jgi:hypothetical protein
LTRRKPLPQNWTPPQQNWTFLTGAISDTALKTAFTGGLNKSFYLTRPNFASKRVRDSETLGFIRFSLATFSGSMGYG